MLAEQGNAAAQFALGSMYIDGHGVPQNDAQAVKWFRKAADQGHSRAQLALGAMYTEGRGVPQSHAEAAKWFRKAADQGDAQAQFDLGNSYLKGRGVPQNDAEAVKWYRKAADQGYADAQFNLGVMYANGRSVPQNYVQAAKWFRKAAEQGYADAQVNLGVSYNKGWGVPQNYVQAHMWLNLAASSASNKETRAKASKYRDIIAAKMTPAQIAEAQAIAKLAYNPIMSMRITTVSPLRAPLLDQAHRDIGPFMMRPARRLAGEPLSAFAVRPLADAERKARRLRALELGAPFRNELLAFLLAEQACRIERRAFEIVSRILDRSVVTPPRHRTPATRAEQVQELAYRGAAPRGREPPPRPRMHRAASRAIAPSLDLH